MAVQAAAPPRYRVSVDEYRTFHSQGFLVVRGLLPPEDVAELREHCADIVAGRVTTEQLGAIIGYADDPTAAERRYNRIHMLHRELAIHERYLLHPRLLDVLEALIGPDVLALQTMLFLKPPGADGQGYHQDSYYIPTLPDSLCGAWVAIDRADEENGCMYFTVGSQNEPIYPDANNVRQHYPGDSALSDLPMVQRVSDTDEQRNGLTPVAERYRGHEVAAVADPGDVVFFGGHVLHRSHRNRSENRFRRAFVSHYCNARSFTQWNYGNGGPLANGHHILARGATHLPFAQPKFGTPCAANAPGPEDATARTALVDMDTGMMEMTPTGKERLDPGAHED